MNRILGPTGAALCVILATIAPAPALAQDPGASRGFTVQGMYHAALDTLGVTRPIAVSAAVPASPATRPAVVPAPSGPVGQAIEAGIDGASSVFGAIASVFTFNVNDLLESPASRMADVRNAHGDDFWAMVADAGFELKEVETHVGLIPEFNFKFDKARDLSDADRDWLERKLTRHARFHTGLTARLKRALVHSLLEAHDLNEGFSLESFDVAFAPLPSVSFSVAPKNSRLLSQEHDALFRATLELKEHLKHSRDAAKPGDAKTE